MLRVYFSSVWPFVISTFALAALYHFAVFLTDEPTLFVNTHYGGRHQAACLVIPDGSRWNAFSFYMFILEREGAKGAKGSKRVVMKLGRNPQLKETVGKIQDRLQNITSPT